MSKKVQTFTEQVRQLIESSGKTCYRIGQETGIDTATISRFMNGKGGLSLANLDALSENLGWKLTAIKTTKTGG